MNSQLFALKAELLKSKHSVIFLISFIAMSLLPIFVGFMLILVMQNQQAVTEGSVISMKMELMSVSADWDALFMILTQGIGIAGIMIFGFVASWTFGREYSENTVKDILSLPTSRTKILNAKFTLYFFWSLALAVYNVALGIAIGWLIQLPGLDSGTLFAYLGNYCITALLTILLGTPVAFFSMLGRGYLAPLGFVALTLVFSQMIAALGYGHYFPWAIPALFSGAGGEYGAQVNAVSYLILAVVAVLGYCMTIAYWKYADHSK